MLTRNNRRRKEYIEFLRREKRIARRGGNISEESGSETEAPKEAEAEDNDHDDTNDYSSDIENEESGESPSSPNDSDGSHD